MDQNESENNEVPLPSKDSSDAKNPSKAEESLRQNRPREKKKKNFSPRATRSKSSKQPESNANSRSTRSTSNKRTHPEKSENLFSKKDKKS